MSFLLCCVAAAVVAQLREFEPEPETETETECGVEVRPFGGLSDDQLFTVSEPAEGNDEWRVTFSIGLSRNGPCAHNREGLGLQVVFTTDDTICTSGLGRTSLAGPVGTVEPCLFGTRINMTMVRTADGWVQTLQNGHPVSILLMAIPRNEGVPRDVTIRLPLPGTHGVVVVWAITVLNESHHELRSFSGRFLVRQPERALRVLGVFIGHDSSLATAVGGELLMVFELERWTRIRQYQFKMSQFEIQHVIIPVVRFMTGMRHPSFDVLAAGKTMASHLGTTDGSLNKNVISSSFVLALQGLFNAGRVEWVDHHWAHATLAMYEVSAASVNRMLIFSYDGNGNDGTFNVYEAQPNAYKLRLLKKEPICLGPYANSASSLGLCRQADVCPTDPAGTFMAYSAMGQANLSWVPAIQAAFSHSAVHDMLVVMRRFFEAHGVQSTALYETVGKNFAATVQRSFELLVLETVQRHFRDWSATLPPSIAIGNGDVAVALTGGSALNIITNHLVREALNPVPVYVPAAPGDAGQVVGIVWAVAPPPFLSRSGEAELTALVGPAVFDGDSLPTYVQARNGSLIHVRFVAERLADGAIVGVVRGRMEWGPRALGHRSLLAYGGAPNVRQRLNRIKNRQWFRPVAPIVLQEEVHLFVDTVADAFSPYMSFAPTLQPWVQDEFPDIAHIDGTARIQTVTSFGGTWIAKLLMQLKALRGHALLVNTSFNEKGLPILNRVSTAFALFDKHSEMAGLLIEDWWFDRSL